ncbi:MAG: YCF48-related protein [Bacteroidota bacterium]
MKRFLILIFLLELFFAFTATAQWEECNNGLYGGDITYFQKLNNKLYVLNYYATPNGGFHSSTDYGKTWQIGSNGSSDFYIFGDRKNIGNNTYVFTGDSIYYTTDNGKNWIISNKGMEKIKVNCFDTDGKNLYAATDSGVYLSVDNGVSWETRNNGLRKNYASSIAVNGKYIFITSENEVYLSTDKGESWVKKYSSKYKLIENIIVDDKNIIIGTNWNYNGLIISNDNGEQWIDTILSNYNINSFAKYRTDIIAGTWGEGLFVSRDKGKTWVPQNSGLTSKYINVIKIYDDIIYVGTQRGLFASVDLGYNFSNIGVYKTTINDVNILDDTILVGTGSWEETGAIFKSTDNGNNWEIIYKELTNAGVRAVAVNEYTLLLGDSHGMIYRSSDGGNTWNKGTKPGSTHLDILSLIVDSNITYTSAYDGGIFYSKDYGMSWYQNVRGSPDVNTFAKYKNYILAGDKGGIWGTSDEGQSWKDFGLQGYFVRSLYTNNEKIYASAGYSGLFATSDEGANWKNIGLKGVSHITDAIVIKNTIFVLVSNRLYISKDNTDTWREISNNFPNRDTLGYMFSITSNKNTIYLCGWNALYSSKDEGESWYSISGGLPDSSFYSLTFIGNDLYVYTRIGLFISKNNGNSWEIIFANINFVHICNIDTTLFAITSNSLYYSNDNGKSWSIRDSLLPGEKYWAFETNGEYLFAGTYFYPGQYLKNLYRSSDGGKNWFKINHNYNEIVSIYTNENNLFTINSNGVLLMSSDNGDNWKPIFHNSELELILLIEKNILWVSTIDGAVYFSTDSGISWQNSGLCHSGVTATATIGNYIFGATRGAGVLLSSNEGITWHNVNKGLTNSDIWNLKINKNYIFAGSRGGGMFRAKLSDFGIVNVKEENTFSVSDDFILYPNPVENILNVRLNHAIEIPCSIQIFNLFGQKVAESIIPGSASVCKMNLQNLQTGMYIVKVNNSINRIIKY